MNRRQFLGTAAGAGAIGWLSHYFGGPAWAGDEAKVAAMGNVSEAYRRASSLGKPLLVFVIPAKDDDKWTRGEIFGALLNHGGRGAYLDLALCEIVCATVADTKLQLPDLKVEGEPLMLLVETDGPKPGASPIAPQINPARTEDDKVAQERLDVAAAGLRAAVAPDAKKLAARAALAEARLPADEVKAIHAAVAAGKAPDALDRGAAIVRARAADRPDILDALAAAAEKRVKGPAPAGAKWAEATGCGVNIDGDRSGDAPCGVAYTPRISRRFLWFFTQ